MSLDQNFQVNLGGVIRLLSDHLYSGPEVYIRELLQNGVDAVTARQLKQPQHAGSIRFEIMNSEGQQPTIMIEDDGVGLTEEEVHQFLATIGQSSKSGEFSRDDFIGQFGIGLLSGFVVSDEITVITQSLKEDNYPVEWKGRVDGTYSVRKLDTEYSPGTRVYLRAKHGKEEFFESETVLGLLKHFGSHLPFEIVLADPKSDSAQRINETPPWRESFASESQRQQASLEYGRSIFGVDFLAAISLSSSSGDVEGYAFVLPFSTSPASRHSHRVYLKNMLLAESVEGLLPDWAFFVRCVINSNKLRPNAARDSFYRDDQLDDARQQLGNCVKDYFVKLAKFDRKRLEHLIGLHMMPIKALAAEDDEFLRLFVDWLPFETSLGTMTLEKYCEHNSTIRYVGTRDEFRQIANVAGAQDVCVFNAGYAYDAELLSKVAVEFPNRNVEQVEVGDLVEKFEDLTLDENEKVFQLIKTADMTLQKYKCGAEAKKFVPDDLPTLYASNDSATFMRSVEQTKEDADEMWQGILENVTTETGARTYASLVFNFRNPLIKKLAGVEDRDLQSRIVEILYLQSLLLGHYPLAAGERAILGNGLLGLLDLFIGGKNG